MQTEPKPLPQYHHSIDAPGLRLRTGRLSFDGSLLFDGLSLDLAPGQWTCLLGPSGVGKSSLLRLIAGLEAGADHPPEVTDHQGRSIAGRFSLMAQQDLLLPWLSVLENATLGARLRGQPAAIAHARDLLAGVGLGDAMDLRPDALSGGMRQRAALVRTLMEERDLVLMDEPFSALDAVTRLKLQDLAAERLAGRTVLLVTHDPLEALRLGHRIHVLSGRPAILDQPLEPPGLAPRPVDDPQILNLQGELLRRLQEAAP